jgi:hypothetical protein
MNYAVEIGFGCHDIHTKFHKNWFRYSRVNWGETHVDTQTHSENASS